LDGFFNVNKAAGWTSFDVVAALRRPLATRRIGHAGTLDPMATGVLVVAVGYATRLLEYVTEATKEYVAEIELGMATDTYDREGSVTERGAYESISRPQLTAALDSFKGLIAQKPPPYSAVKIAGQAAYIRMRRGEPIDLPARNVEVHSIELEKYEPPLALVRIVCGKGTYIRSIAHDLGQQLRCGAHLKSLERTRVGPFHIADAVEIEVLRGRAVEGTASDVLIAADRPLLAEEAVILAPPSSKTVLQGQPISANRPPRRPGRPSRAYSWDGRFLALLEAVDSPLGLRPKKVFSRLNSTLISSKPPEKLSKSGRSRFKTA
jgi:tRNA pseudouridine55 synthase